MADTVAGKTFFSLKNVNLLLSFTVVLLSLYILLAPFVPQIAWWLTGRDDAAQQSTSAVQAARKEPVPDGEVLIIPRLDFKQNIQIGKTQAELRKGAWLLPDSSTPDKGSNTVIVGHRFTYAGPAVFYYLDKVELNDKLFVQWQGKEYAYKVNSITTVPPTAVQVEAPTTQSQLTLYTCTPLLTAKNRLVITAQLEGIR